MLYLIGVPIDGSHGQYTCPANRAIWGHQVRRLGGAEREQSSVEFDSVLIEAARGRPTPLLVIDRRIIRETYVRVTESLPGVELFYAVKANPHPEVARTLHGLGCGFEVSSTPELDMLLGLGVPPERIVSSNPVKAVEFIRRASAVGVARFVFDSSEELRKLRELAPESELCLRLVVDNSGSEWPLSRKYGVEVSAAPALLAEARDLGLRVVGLTFHVGSQCLEPRAWIGALDACREVFESARQLGIHLDFVNLGGGLPVRHLKPTPCVAEIGRQVIAHVRESFAGPIRLAIEPGRALIGEAAALVGSVIGKATRGDERWLYLDVGVFNCLMETIGGFRYELRTEVDGPPQRFTLAGPSCDSVDVLFADALLPDLKLGDRLYVLNAGAYTLSYASSFNGFPPPDVRFVDE